MTSKRYLSSAIVLFCASVLLACLNSCGPSGREKKEMERKEKRAVDSLAAVQKLDATLAIRAELLDSLDDVLSWVVTQVNKDGTFSYQSHARNKDKKFRFGDPDFTSMVFPRNKYGFDPQKLTQAIELELAMSYKEDKTRFKWTLPDLILDQEFMANPGELFLLIRKRRAEGVWPKEILDGKTNAVNDLLNELPQYQYLKILYKTAYYLPEKANAGFERGRIKTRVFFVDIRNKAIVGHYYVNAENEVMVEYNWSEELEEVLYHKLVYAYQDHLRAGHLHNTYNLKMVKIKDKRSYEYPN